MKHTFLISVVGLSFLSGSAPARDSTAPEGYNAIHAKAVAHKVDLAVYVYGAASWDKSGEPLKALTFGSPAWRAALPQGVLTACVEVPDNAGIALPDSDFNQGLVWNFPAVVYFDSRGHLIGRLEGLSPQRGCSADLADKLEDFRQTSLNFAARLESAKNATGVEKVRQLGRALDLLDFKVARAQGELQQALAAADPKDETGYVAKYTYNLWDFGGEMASLASQKKYDEGLALIAKHKAQTVLTREQRQAVEVQRYVLCRFWQGHEAEAEEALKTALKMDPSSDTGIGCRGVLLQIDQDRRYKSQYYAVLAAEKAMDAAAYAKLGEETLASTIQMPYRAKDHGHPMPAYDRPQGALISKTGMLAFSYPPANNWDYKITTLRPLVLRDEEPGLFVMDPGVRPWAQVILAKEATLTGIVVINRLDGCQEFQMPLVVWTSRDGEAWREIYRSTQQQDCWQVKVPVGLKARHVRVGRDSSGPLYFNLSNILVYGKP